MTLSHTALIACQRSGTHLLCEIVNSNPCAALLSEPFTPTWEYLRWQNYVQMQPSERYPSASAADAMALLDEYLRIVERDVRTRPAWYGAEKKPELRALGLDVKYNQLKCVNPLINDLCAKPLLLDYFAERKFRIIHLIRNPLHSVISMIIANRRGVWHTYEKSRIDGQFQIPTVELVNHLRWIKFEREEFIRLARGMQVHTIAYEDLMADLDRVEPGGELPPDTKVFARLAELWDVPNKFRHKCKLNKVICKPYAELIENFDELMAELKSSEFAELAYSI